MKFIGMFILLLFSSYVMADMGSYYQNYIDKITNNKIVAFYTSCSTDTGRRSLFIEVGTRQGLFVEYSNKAVVNLALIKVETNRLVITDTHGGVYTQEKVYKHVNLMYTNEFHVLNKDNLSTVLGVVTLKTCME